MDRGFANFSSRTVSTCAKVMKHKSPRRKTAFMTEYTYVKVHAHTSSVGWVSFGLAETHKVCCYNNDECERLWSTLMANKQRIALDRFASWLCFVERKNDFEHKSPNFYLIFISFKNILTTFWNTVNYGLVYRHQIEAPGNNYLVVTFEVDIGLWSEVLMGFLELSIMSTDYL